MLKLFSKTDQIIPAKTRDAIPLKTGGSALSPFAVTEMINLAAMSTKITIPVLFAGILIDIAVVVSQYSYELKLV